MAFEVADFTEFIAILRVHPEWQSELRRVLLDDELAELRRSMEASFARQAALIETITERLDRLEASFERQAQMIEAIIARLDHRTGRLDGHDLRFNRIDNELGIIKGRLNELWYGDRAAGIFGHVMHGVRPISFADLDEVRAARKSGAISADEWKDLRSLDLLVQGRDDDDVPQTVALEVAFTVDEGDVSRAARRAAVIARTGVPCLAAVGGEQVRDGLLLAAQAAGVAVLREGDILFWPGAA